MARKYIFIVTSVFALTAGVFFSFKKAEADIAYCALTPEQCPAPGAVCLGFPPGPTEACEPCFGTARCGAPGQYVCEGARGGNIFCGGNETCECDPYRACTSLPNACDQTAPGYVIDGVCNAVTPPNPANYGNSCTVTSDPNACGLTTSATGTIGCDGSTCSASKPAPPPNPANYGNSCTVTGAVANACGEVGTATGTIQCNSVCSAFFPGPTVPPNPVGYGTACDDGDPSTSGTTIQCGGGCGGGVLVPPTLSVSSFTANPSSGNAPLSSYLSVTVGGTATGTINYTFWWNCAYTGTSVSAATSQCGGPDGTNGNQNGNKFNGVSASSQNSVSHSYATAGNYTPLVIVERGSLAARAVTTVTVGNAPPTISSVILTEPDYCYTARQARISWVYSDPTGDPQSSYQVQLGVGGNFSPPAIDFTSGPSSANLYNATNLAFNTNYVARVRAWDSQGGVSNWQNQTVCSGPGCAGNQRSWTTPRHYYPSYAQFTWNPFIIHAKEPIQFFNQSTCFNDNNSLTACRRWEYDFDYNTGVDSSNNPNPVYTYSTPGDYAITERVIDTEGYACPSSLLPVLVNVTRSIPVWKEVSPSQ